MRFLGPVLWKVIWRVLWLLSRALPLVGVLRTVHRPAKLDELEHLASATDLLQRLLPLSARNLAVALALLPAALRREAGLAYLCCRALDAYEDLILDCQQASASLHGALHYLLGGAAFPPAGITLEDGRESDRIEALLTRRLSVLRDAVANLPPAAQIRVHRLLRCMGTGMLTSLRPEQRTEHRRASAYADQVLGPAVKYALDLLLPNRQPEARLGRAVARLLQIANDLRDRASDRPLSSVSAESARTRLLLLALDEALLLPPLLRKLEACSFAGALGAVAWMALTTSRFFQRELGSSSLRPRRWLIARMILSALSPRAYQQTIDALEEDLFVALWTGALQSLALAPSAEMGGTETPAAPLASWRFLRLIVSFCPKGVDQMSLLAVAVLMHTAQFLHSRVNERPLAGPLPRGEALSLLLGDHAALCAMVWTQQCGITAMLRFGEWLIDWGTAPTAHCDGAVANFLSRVVAEKLQLDAAAGRVFQQMSVAIGSSLWRLDMTLRSPQQRRLAYREVMTLARMRDASPESRRMLGTLVTGAGAIALRGAA